MWTHTFRMIKQRLGWPRPKLRTPEAGDRWAWLIIAAHTQLRLVRSAAADLRRPWEKPAKPGRLIGGAEPGNARFRSRQKVSTLAAGSTDFSGQTVPLLVTGRPDR